MVRRTTDVHDLAVALRAPAFDRAQRAAGPVDLDPLTSTTLVLELSQIKPYEHNPRQAENPEYPRLLESIRARKGLTTPLTVTKRPGDSLYTVAAGGNSRLHVLRELYEMTSDEAFNRISCQFEPWVSDCQVLANHLIENDVRGNMTFADKARAILHWCELYENEHPDDPPLTQRELAERLAESGFQIAQSTLSRFLFAAYHLVPFLPKAFQSGLGREPIERLIRLRTVAEQYWRERSRAGSATLQSSFDAVFAAACAEGDSHRDDWTHEVFVAAFARHLADALDLPAKLVVLDLDSLVHGAPIDVQNDNRLDVQKSTEEGWVFERERQQARERAERQRKRPRRPSLEEGHKPSRTPDANAARPTVPAEEAPLDVEEHRARLCADAAALAGRHGLGPLLKGCNVGYGFFIEPPEPPFEATQVAEGDTVTALTGAAAWIWWWLAACAQQLDSSHLALIRRDHPAAWLVQLFDGAPRHLGLSNPRAALAVLVGEPDVAVLAQDLLVSEGLSDGEFEALHEIMASCRRLLQAAQRAGASLWC